MDIVGDNNKEVYYSNMKVRDLLEMEIDIDVYDNVCEELAIAFCGATRLTEEGKKHFANVLEYDVKILEDSFFGKVAIVDVDDKEGIWQKKLEGAKELFYSLAGYCPLTDYERWFVDV